jgi:hypothetical protein
MICARAVTFQTTLGDVFGSRSFKGEDFALVTTTVNVLRAGAKAGFATTGFSPVFGLQKIVPVAGLLKIVKDILVAGLAGIGPYVWRSGRLLSRFVGWTCTRYL